MTRDRQKQKKVVTMDSEAFLIISLEAFSFFKSFSDVERGKVEEALKQFAYLSILFSLIWGVDIFSEGRVASRN